MRRPHVRTRALIAPALFTLFVGGSCGGTSGPADGSTSDAAVSLVPADYRTSFTQSRNCRTTTEHAAPNGPTSSIATNIVVYVNPSSAAAYDAKAAALPAGTLVIKEEHDGPECNHVIGWSVMHKEPGYDPAHNDWHWQHLAADGHVESDGKVAVCISCHQTSSDNEGIACVNRDWQCTSP